MKNRIYIVTLFLIIFTTSCKNECKDITIKQNEISKNELSCIVKTHYRQMKKDAVLDSVSLVKLVKLNNTIRFYNLTENNKRYLKFIELFNSNHMLEIYNKFDFQADSTLSPYSKKINMHLFPSKKKLANDYYLLKGK